MNRARRIYLKSKHKRDINFCLIVYLRQDEAEIREWIDMIQEPNYQKVASGRPLLYMMFWEEGSAAKLFGSVEKARAHIDSLRKRIMATGQKNPYFVVLTQGATVGAAAVKEAGVDAISAYTSVGGPDYSRLCGAHVKDWDAMKATGKKVVPNLTAGWGGPRDNKGDTLQPKPAELTAHLRSAFSWVDANPDAAEAKTMLFYAWNEVDEGGWLVPDKGHGTAKSGCHPRGGKGTRQWCWQREERGAAAQDRRTETLKTVSSLLLGMAAPLCPPCWFTMRH